MQNTANLIVAEKPELNYQQKKTGMTDPTLYRNNNEIQRICCSEALKEFSTKIKWKQQAKVLDVGSGDGGFTCDVLKSYIPRNFEKLIGVDLSPEMVKHANLHHKEDRVEFRVMDIAESTDGMVEQYDHIFSFFVLHWISEQEKALSNIYSMLLPGGDFLLVFPCYHPFFDIYRIMGTKTAWSEYTHDAEKYVSRYHDSQTPAEDLRKIMVECGFKDVDVRNKGYSFDYGGFDSLKRMATSVNPFVGRMPPTVRDSFIDDCMKELRIKMDSVCDERIKKNAREFEIGWSTIYAYGAK